MNNKFVIVIPFYNVEEWVDKCVKSVLLQDNRDYKCILVDDISTDKSCEIIESLVSDDERFTLVKNKEKKYALQNIYEAIQSSGQDNEDIIVTLDGDDWLATKRVLSTLDKTYNDTNCWMTYGSYIEYPSRRIGPFCKKIDPYVVDNNLHRESRWVSSHLRTFKRGLWNKIDPNDLKGSDGKFYRMTWDQAFMFPMLEMSAHRAHHISSPLYVYNRDNPINDDKVNHRLQIETENIIRSKSKYAKIRSIE